MNFLIIISFFKIVDRTFNKIIKPKLEKRCN